MKIIDIRCRPPYKSALHGFKTSGILERVPAFEVPDPESFLKGSMELFIKEMDEAGVAVAVAVGRNRERFETPNDELAELVQAYPGRIVGIGGLDCSNKVHNAVDEIERCVKRLGLRGVSIEPGGNKVDLNWDDPSLYPIYSKCDELKIPIFLTTAHRQGASIDHTRPVHIDHIATKFPRLKIVCAHACWPYVMEMIGVAQRCRNVYVSPDGYTFRPGGDLYALSAHRYIENQFLFGSAYPLNPMKESVEGHAKFGLSQKVLDKIFYENSARLLDL